MLVFTNEINSILAKLKQQYKIFLIDRLGNSSKASWKKQIKAYTASKQLRMNLNY